MQFEKQIIDFWVRMDHEKLYFDQNLTYKSIKQGTEKNLAFVLNGSVYWHPYNTAITVKKLFLLK